MFDEVSLLYGFTIFVTTLTDVSSICFKNVDVVSILMSFTVDSSCVMVKTTFSFVTKSCLSFNVVYERIDLPRDVGNVLNNTFSGLEMCVVGNNVENCRVTDDDNICTFDCGVKQSSYLPTQFPARHFNNPSGHGVVIVPVMKKILV